MSKRIQSQGSQSGEGSIGNDETQTLREGAGKRKDYTRRSVAWKHFTEFAVDGKKKGKCNYCERVYASESTNGTTNLLSHMRSCTLNPANQNSGQTKLSFNATINEETGEKRVNLTAWKFDQKVSRKSIAEMIIIDELPFKFVENEGFRRCMKACQPALMLPSRSTIRRDCYQLYLDEKTKLKIVLRHSVHGISLTTDTWTSIQRINYMCLTAHFIDNDWNLRKKVLNFCPVFSNRGLDIGKAIEICLLEWGLKSVRTITVDNASSNDVALGYLKKKSVNWGQLCILQGKWIHVRCVAHIINLIVQEGLKEIRHAIDSVRAAVKYIRQSPARTRKFMEFVKLNDCGSTKTLCLDVATRWNSTYLMLDVAQMYEKAFYVYDLDDRDFREELNGEISKPGPGVPNSESFKIVRTYNVFLKHFYLLTLRVSGTKYITTNSYLDDICGLYGVLSENLSNRDNDLREMASSMKKKFDKYWGSVEKFNMLLFIACAFDPRHKFDYVEISLSTMYGDVIGRHVAGLVKGSFYELFHEYKKLLSSERDMSSSSSSVSYVDITLSSSASDCDIDPYQKMRDKNMAMLKRRKAESGSRDAKSELDRYLTEDDENEKVWLESKSFAILDWWKKKSAAFPILSLMARDILAIPVSSVASESVFSTRGRVFDSFRSSLTPKIVQALICTQDWIRSDGSIVDVEEKLEDLEKFEQEITQVTAQTSLVDV